MQRYKVDLSELFSDHRQKVFVGRRKEWQRVECLLGHIQSVFQIQTNVYLTNGENILFPEAEALDVIQENDQLRVHSASVSNSLKSTQRVCAPKTVTANGKAHVDAAQQNGKRKCDTQTKPIPKIDEESSSDSDEDDDENPLPKIFVGLETVQAKDAPIEDLPKSKRKRVRKRKSKKKTEETPPKVVVKTYGKSKNPPIVENGAVANHVRFNDKEEAKTDDETEIKDEPYKNLNQNTVPRIVKAVVQPSAPLALNDDAPSVPEYDDVLEIEVDDIMNNKKSKKKQRKPIKPPVEIKRELIEANTFTVREPSPVTWDAEVDQAKETFLANYTGEEFWITLREALDNFPSISIPSKNDIIAYRFINDDAQSYLAFVERADDGESDDMPAVKLTLRRLNISGGSPPQTLTATLDQLIGIRLVATYEP